jgi:threonyl-tRNA synthetase
MSASSSPLHITLPDGKTLDFKKGVTGAEIAQAIGPGLAKAALILEVDGAQWDLFRPIEHDAKIRIITRKDSEALELIRHDAAHVLAMAVQELFPGTQVTIGPAIDDGFYYDFEVAEPFTPEDIAAFENEMRKVSAEKFPFVREEVNRAEAQKRFVDDPLKLERLSELRDDEVISTYTDGPFVDLCRGPHVPDTSRVKHFKLTHTAGAYWRGDSKRQMLQRIYGTAFFKKDELDAHLLRIEEAKKRDHRLLGKQLDLFMMHPYSPGAVFWTERGTVLFNALTDFIRERQRDDFKEIKTPLLYNKGLWETSGHWGKYRENMFLVLDTETNEHDVSLKPMNCPSHYLLYQSHKHSYRELPLRYVTFDVLHRNEVTGALSGLVRVRQFQQDDCHVFIREDQIASEVAFLLRFILSYYETFGLTAKVKFATRPETRIGSDELWDRAETALKAALESTGHEYELKPGDGAFYGPKVDFDVTDSIGRPWQLGTIQLDYNAPERFKLEYVGEDNAAHTPVVIHRAVSGSLERFIAILIEHFAGAFPVWLAPEQVRVLPITDDYREYAERVTKALHDAGVRVHLDSRSETLKYRVAEGARMKVPYMLVVGKREAEQGTVAVNVRGAGKEQKPNAIPLDLFVERVVEENRSRSLVLAAHA